MTPFNNKTGWYVSLKIISTAFFFIFKNTKTWGSTVEQLNHFFPLAKCLCLINSIGDDTAKYINMLQCDFLPSFLYNLTPTTV